LWAELERRLKKIKKKPKNKKELFNVLKREWNKIDKGNYINLISSMPWRIQACINSNGGSTKY